MSSVPKFDTRLSLLLKLGDSSSQEDVWPVFVEKYGTLVYHWSLKWGATPQDAEDIVQQTLLSVFLKIKHFEKNKPGAFRAWMHRIARNLWLKIVEKSIRQNRAVGTFLSSSHHLKLVRSGSAREDLLHQFDALACEELRSLAFDRVSRRVDPKTWQAFQLCDHEDLPGQVVADQLGLSLKAVHLAALRVRRMLKQELKEIDPTWGDSFPDH